MAKAAFTDRGLRSLQPAPIGARPTHWDALVPGFGVRVTDKGSASCVVMRRVNGELIRRTVGRPWKVPLPKDADLPFSLAEIRAEARRLLAEMASGVDPKKRREAVARQAAAEARAAEREAESAFELVAERFIAEHVVKLRSSAEVTAAIRREVIPRWEGRPIKEISRADVTKMLRAVKDRPYIAHHLLSYVRKLFNWAIATDEFDLRISPCDRLKSTEIVGAKTARNRVLSDQELIQVWQKAHGLGEPWGPFFRMLLLTGQRLREVANAAWPEFDLDQALWTIPAARMKGNTVHVVPLAPAAVALLRELSRGTGPFVFSTTSGNKPIAAFSKVKERLDHALGGVGGWRIHDLRRTMRTHLGALPIPSNVAEMCIAHAQPGMHKVYDRWAYADEKRRAMELWAARLLSIVEPATLGKVVRLAVGAQHHVNPRRPVP